ncbi:unnamed protein product [Paramecium primaurelia]|uniref:Uncharacterized protein n=1 Tax=Paramecium primaurelia TaxID=5886 RepID=A0A8S1NWL6_PARPR|nr:unnamed protein product [Paramecium primaurelia]
MFYSQNCLYWPQYLRSKNMYFGLKRQIQQSRTNLDCKQKLSECITNSNICILGDPCDEYTYLNYCIQSKNQLCLWIQNSCINYSKCKDAKLKTFYESQIVAPFCTSNIQNIYHLLFVLNMKIWKPVYLVGINYGNEMKNVNPLKSPDNNFCRLNHNVCISDGYKCIQVVQKCIQQPMHGLIN